MGTRDQLVGWRPLFGAMDAAAFASWLGEEVSLDDGVDLKLNQNTLDVLVLAFQAGILEEEDVPAEDGSLDEGQVKECLEVFESAYADSVKESKGKLSHRRVDLVKFSRWFRARFLDDTVVDESVQGAVVKPSTAMSEDMAFQGATAGWQLGWIELALALCRVPAREECKGYAYRAPWTAMDGGKMAIKYKQPPQGNFDEILAECVKSGDLEPVDAHVTQLSQLLLDEKNDNLAQRTASHILSMWQLTKKSLKSPGMILYYMVKFRRAHVGRGLPMLIDRNLINEATAAQISGQIGEPMRALTLDGLKGGASSAKTSSSGSSTASGGSSLPPSASAVGSEAQASQHAEVLSAVKELSKTCESVSSQMQNLLGRVRTLESNTGGKKCTICGSPDHLSYNCPNRAQGKGGRGTGRGGPSGGAADDSEA